MLRLNAHLTNFAIFNIWFGTVRPHQKPTPFPGIWKRVPKSSLVQMCDFYNWDQRLREINMKIIWDIKESSAVWWIRTIRKSCRGVKMMEPEQNELKGVGMSFIYDVHLSLDSIFSADARVTWNRPEYCIFNVILCFFMYGPFKISHLTKGSQAKWRKNTTKDHTRTR